MKNISMNGQNVRKTLAAAIAAMTMALTTSCGSVAEIQPSPAAAPAVTAAQNDVQPTETEAPAETAAPETEAPAESAAETKEETASSETAPSSETKKPAQTTASRPAPGSSDNTSGGSTNNTPAAQTTAPETQPEQRVAQPIDMTADRLLSTSVRDLCELSANDFEIVDPNSIYGSQAYYPGVRCASFPNYIFMPNFTWTEGTPENAFEIADPNNPGYKFVLSNDISFVNLVQGAYVGDGVTVGMSYNELKAIFGDGFKVQAAFCSGDYAAYVDIGGRTWGFFFELSEEQKSELTARMNEMAQADGEIGVTPGNASSYAVDISDMNPTSVAAVYLNL